MLRVFIIDPNRAERRWLRLRLERTAGLLVVGEAARGADGIQLARRARAEVVVLDLGPARDDSLRVIRALSADTPPGALGVVVVTEEGSLSQVSEVLDCGARGFLLLRDDIGLLGAAVRRAAAGEITVSARAMTALAREFVRRGNQLRAPQVVPGAARILTPAEEIVVAHLAGGYTTNEALATKLNISVNTVRAQIATSLRKTESANRTALALWGLRHGLDRLVTA